MYRPARFEGLIRDPGTPVCQHASSLTLSLPQEAPPTPEQMQALSEMMRDRDGCEWAVDSAT